MSKRAQTTGAPKRRRRRAQPAPGVASPAPEAGDASYRSRAEREAQLQTWAIRGVIAVAALLALMVAATFAVEQLVVPNQAVARVNGEDVSVREFRQEYQLEYNRLRLQLNQFQSAGYDLQQLAQQEPYKTWINEVSVPDQLGLRVINDIIDDRLLAQEAEARGLSVDEASIRGAVEEFFGFDATEVALIGAPPTATLEPTITPTPFVSPTPSPTPMPSATPDPAAEAAEPEEETQPTVTPQPTVVEPTRTADEVRQDFEQNERDYRSYLDTAGVAAETVTAFFERQALEAQLADRLIPDGGSLLFADVRHILVEDESTANAALAALQGGESFYALARAISTDAGSGARGGELGMAYVGNYVPEFRLAIEEAAVGALVGPVESEFGFHILQVRGKEARSGDEIASMLESAKRGEVEALKQSLREEHSDNFEIFDSWLDYIPRG